MSIKASIDYDRKIAACLTIVAEAKELGKRKVLDAESVELVVNRATRERQIQERDRDDAERDDADRDAELAMTGLSTTMLGLLLRQTPQTLKGLDRIIQEAESLGKSKALDHSSVEKIITKAKSAREKIGTREAALTEMSKPRKRKIRKPK